MTPAEVEAELLRRWPESQLDPSLDRIQDLLGVLGDPHTAYPVILVAGTNGKTSTSRMIEALVRAAGLRTGLYTSPHLERVAERIVVDGEALDDEALAAAYEDLAPYLEIVDARHEHPLSFFEVLTAMAYATFAEAPVDVAVVEVGLGGTWDATNLVDAQVAVVTPIGLDHQAYLGDTLAAIAGEKAGIIKPGSLAIVAQQPLEAAEVLVRRCAEVGATVAREGLEFGVATRSVAVGGQLLTLRGLGGVYDEVFTSLLGAHQAHNAAVALAAAEGLLGGGGESLDPDLVRTAFAGVRSPGRLEVVRRSPTVLIDAAHNPAGAAALADAVTDSFTFDRLVGVVGVLSDKDARGILDALEPVLSEVVVTRPPSPRAMNPDVLGALAVAVFGENRVVVVPGVADAVAEAVALAEDSAALGGSGVLVAGSVVLAGEVRRLLRG
ncbi:MAG TPA: folylpolyglutamate synthase/dihydrofolate synthase family protein [Actinomycetes bacterium]